MFGVSYEASQTQIVKHDRPVV